MTPELLNTIGLTSNIFGVILIFFFGLPQPSHDEGVSLGLEDGTPLGDGTTVGERNVKIRKRKARYKFFAYVALSLMLFGFVLQFLALHIDLIPFH
ncbi:MULTISPECIES: hypothetical protein [Enterobacteriaceae]|nr:MULTISPECIES: hypothetical protein [Enterobacteriaceae]MCR1553313.1 hypothetical protein [Enterobacter cloacae]MDU3639793.1 hypothetical protein [Bifidobacterium longum]ELN3890444.1 hypothetical protein [Klebsiella michiganensis]ELS5413312.1 hypothetical protein [Klebsiella michiganensis]ELS5414845.1 hypothetical protein [Klebsiella michiganensis]